MGRNPLPGSFLTRVPLQMKVRSGRRMTAEDGERTKCLYTVGACLMSGAQR